MLPICGIDVPLAEAKDSFKCWQADSRRTVSQGLLSLFFKADKIVSVIRMQGTSHGSS